MLQDKFEMLCMYELFRRIDDGSMDPRERVRSID